VLFGLHDIYQQTKDHIVMHYICVHS